MAREHDQFVPQPLLGCEQLKPAIAYRQHSLRRGASHGGHSVERTECDRPGIDLARCQISQSGEPSQSQIAVFEAVAVEQGASQRKDAETGIPIFGTKRHAVKHPCAQECGNAAVVRLGPKPTIQDVRLHANLCPVRRHAYSNVKADPRPGGKLGHPECCILAVVPRRVLDLTGNNPQGVQSLVAVQEKPDALANPDTAPATEAGFDFWPSAKHLAACSFVNQADDSPPQLRQSRGTQKGILEHDSAVGSLLKPAAPAKAPKRVAVPIRRTAGLYLFNLADPQLDRLLVDFGSGVEHGGTGFEVT